ncbi:MAG: polyhydroxyalkanoic acid system family protein [Burkholderiaceae bacterium]|nr:polyhydroxyalkanoic acid system family protein [Burkholderiaceae bacterium]
MSSLSLTRKHKLGIKRARQAASRVAAELDEAFGMHSEWDGNTLRFTRSGVTGTLVVSKDSVRLDAKLGLLLAAFKSRIEAQVHHNFDEYFG